jgi:hypothetical protein
MWVRVFFVILERYRIQCDKFEGLWLVVHELVTRLKDHFADLRDGVPLRLSFMGPLPLQYYFELIDSHFEVRLRWSQHTELYMYSVTRVAPTVWLWKPFCFIKINSLYFSKDSINKSIVKFSVNGRLSFERYKDDCWPNTKIKRRPLWPIWTHYWTEHTDR